MPTLTIPELREKLESLRGSTMISIVARTEVKLVGGKKCPLAGLEKQSYVNGVINWSYENAVNNQRVREDQPTNRQGEVIHFKPLPRTWGQRLHAESGHLLPTVEHKGEFYLEVKVQRSLAHRYFLGKVEKTDEEVNPHLPERKESARQMVEKPVILRDYKLTSIEQITLNGETYEIAK